MKKIILFMASLLMMASVVFAQESMTHYTTNDLFATDVDNFMNVNEWQTVNPEKIFGCIGYSGSSIRIGLAGKTSKMYIGSYFGGQLPELKSEKNIAPNKKLTSWKGGSLVGDMLFGFGNMGIKTKFKLVPTELSTTKVEGGNKTKKTDYDIYASAKFGINLAAKNERVYKTWADLKLESYVDKKNVKDDSGTLTTDKNASSHYVYLGGGTKFDISKKGFTTQTIAFNGGAWFQIMPSKRSYNATAKKHVVTKGDMWIKVPFGVDYTARFDFTEAFALSIGAGADTYLKYEKDYDYEKVGSAKSYNTSRKSTTTFKIDPEVKAGFVWYAVPEKFSLNFGTYFKLLGAIEMKTEKTQTRDASSGKVSDTDTTKTFTVNKSEAGQLSADSGFTWNITKNVALDGNFNIANKLVGNDLESSISGLDDFFDPTLKLQVSFKY